MMNYIKKNPNIRLYTDYNSHIFHYLCKNKRINKMIINEMINFIIKYDKNLFDTYIKFYDEKKYDYYIERCLMYKQLGDDIFLNINKYKLFFYKEKFNQKKTLILK
jgi:hypothetical protein